MPWLMDSRSRTDEIVAVVYDLIESGGIAAVTYRAVALRVRLSHSTVHDHYPQLSHLLKVAAHDLARRRESVLRVRLAREGLAGLIPADEDELRAAAVWLSFRDHERIEPMLGYVMAEARDRERQIIQHMLDDEVDMDAGPDAGPDAGLALALQLVTDGLERAMTCREEPLPIEKANEVLASVRRGLRAVAEAEAA